MTQIVFYIRDDHSEGICVEQIYINGVTLHPAACYLRAAEIAKLARTEDVVFRARDEE